MNIVIDIKQFVNTDEISNVEPFLYFSDDIEKLKMWEAEGHFVVPILNETNRDVDFSSYKHAVTMPEEIDDDYYVKIWQRFAGLPWEILTTDRCIVREMTVEDVRELYEVYSDDSITDYTEPLFPDYEDELEYTHNYIEKVYSYFGFGTWVIVNKENGRIIGRAGFNYREGYDTPELGYVIDKRYQGKGYATEVCKALIDYGFEYLGFYRISAYSAMENEPSVRILKRLGFKQDTIEPFIEMELKGRKIRLERFVKDPC